MMRRLFVGLFAAALVALPFAGSVHVATAPNGAMLQIGSVAGTVLTSDHEFDLTFASAPVLTVTL